MKKVLLLLGYLCLTALVSMSRPALASTTVTVQGQNDAAVDRANVQQALDTAAPGDTVSLSGTFQLDGEPLEIRRSGIILAGVALDNDGDGSTNEDWIDTIDNDGDGVVDEDGWDTWLYGLTDANGDPFEDLFADSFYNYALIVQGGNGDLADIAVHDLAFSGFARHIALFAGVELSQGNLCDGVSVTGETMRRITVSRNFFLNANRALIANGAITDLLFADNVSRLDSSAYDLLVQSGFACFNVDGSQAPVFLGAPHKPTVVNNHFTGAADVESPTKGAFWLNGAEFADVSGNHAQTYTLGLGLVISGKNNHIHHNDVYDSMLGITGVLAGQNNRIANNVIADSMWAIVLDVAASGFRVVNNDFSNNSQADIFLHGYADVLIPHDNQIVGTDFTTNLVLDSFDGAVSPEEIDAANSFVGAFATTYNANIPADVREHLQNDLALPTH